MIFTSKVDAFYNWYGDVFKALLGPLTVRCIVRLRALSIGSCILMLLIYGRTSWSALRQLHATNTAGIVPPYKLASIFHKESAITNSSVLLILRSKEVLRTWFLTPMSHMWQNLLKFSFEYALLNETIYFFQGRVLAAASHNSSIALLQARGPDGCLILTTTPPGDLPHGCHLVTPIPQGHSKYGWSSEPQAFPSPNVSMGPQRIRTTRQSFMDSNPETPRSVQRSSLSFAGIPFKRYLKM